MHNNGKSTLGHERITAIVWKGPPAGEVFRLLSRPGRRLRQSFFVILLVCSCGCTSKHFFYPTADAVRHPERAYEDVFFSSLDGTRLHGWFVPATGEPRGTVVHFHGNAQNLTHHYVYVHWLPAAGYNLFTFDYRGFGQSAGKPDFSGVIEDGLAALAYVHRRKDIDGDRLFVFGQSMGAAIAATVVGKFQPPGVVGVLLDSPLSSFRRIAKETLIKMDYSFPLYHMPSLLVPDGNSPIHYIGELSPRPLLIIHGAADQIISPEHAYRLFKEAAEPKRLVILPNVRHVDAFSYQIRRTRPMMLNFFASSLKPKDGEIGSEQPAP